MTYTTLSQRRRVQRRVRMLLALVLLLLAFLAGMTAQYWDPYARQLDELKSTQYTVHITDVEEDQTECVGTPASVVAYEPDGHGGAYIKC